LGNPAAALAAPAPEMEFAALPELKTVLCGLARKLEMFRR
jgi:hypothetical protein